MLTVTSIDHFVLNVHDVEKSAAWYGSVLGMTREDSQPVSGGERRVSMKFGVNTINLRPIDASQEDWFTAAQPAFGSADLCFLTQATPNEVVDHLNSCGVTVELGPVAKSGARGKIQSVYCRDPDGSLVEISSYPHQVGA